MAEPNVLFSRGQMRRLAGHAHLMASAETELARRLSEPRTRGLRAWEYGILLGYLQHLGERPERALDVGSGDSAFPRYLVSSGAVRSVTALDLPDAFEDQGAGSRGERRGVRRLAGSMLDIPAHDDSFDLVTCISAIEHLDGHSAAHRRDPENNPKLPYDTYLEHTATALREMVRVLRSQGILYLTTDAYLPELQRSDAWTKFDTGGVIWSAYRFEDISSVFLETLRRAGLSLAGSPQLERRLLIEDPGRSTFRGRYFTTFALLGRKVG